MLKKSLIFFTVGLVFTSCLSTKEVVKNTTTQLQSMEEGQTEKNTSEDNQVIKDSATNTAGTKAEPESPPPLPALSLQAGDTPDQIRVGQQFASGFTALVLDADTQSQAEGILVTVSYPKSRINDDITFATQELTSDAQGLVSFIPPATDFACNSEVTFSVESKDGKMEVSIPYKVRTNRHNKGGAISIVDYTKDGSPVRDNSRSASALLTAFLRNGFSNVGLIDFVDEIHAGNQTKIYQAAKNMIAGTSNFFVYGTVKYNGEITQEGSTYSIPLIGEITCLDVKTGKELYHTVIEVVGTGTSEWAALDNARKEMYGPEAATRIIYGM